MKQKRNWLMIGLLVLALLVVTACSSTESTPAAEPEVEPASSDVAQEDETPSDAAEQAEEPAVGTMRRDGNSSTQLILGSFQLEDTEYAISTEQAATLLPLWKGYRALIGSDTASSVEQEALVNQIAEEFTPQQLTYLSETEFSQEEKTAMMEELGIESQFTGMGRMGGGEDGTGGDLSEEQRAEMQALREANGGQGGGPGGGTGGTQMDPEQLATLQAERAANGGGAQGNTQDEVFLPALIELLESKING